MKSRSAKASKPFNRNWIIGAGLILLLIICVGVALKFGKKSSSLAKAPPPIPKVHEDKLEACYVSFLKSQPQHDEGSVVVSWEVNKKGEVSSTKLVQNDLKDEKFTKCVLENLKKVQFGQVTGAMTIPHRYNFKRRAPASL